MKLKSFANVDCSVAQTVEAIGERWTLLIIRDAFLGARRFEQFQKNLGIARNILTKRLNALVAEGVLEKRPVEAGRFEYRLTEKGLDLQPVLLALTHWGDKHKAPNGPRIEFVDRETGQPVQTMAVHAADGRVLRPREIKGVAGRGASAATSE